MKAAPFLLLLAGLVCPCLAAPPPPNIVFVLADDLGWSDTEPYGSKYYETPNLQRLAAQGMKFNRYYSAPNCQPARAAIMTGQYGPRTGVYTVGGIDRFNWQSRPLRPVDNVAELPAEKTTLAQMLKGAGYKTAMFGKWHLGQRGEFHPSQRGFDEAIVSMGAHFDFETSPAVEVPKGVYLADWLTDKSIDFLRRNKDNRFFLYLPHFAVHSPHHAKPELIARFKDKPAVGGHKNPTYAAMIYSVDESVGRIMKTLDELKLADNTILIFSSDNGGVGGYVREGIRESDITDNAPLRSGKGSLYEGGIRDPFIVRWPGVTKPGSVADEPIAHIDLFPTFLEIVGGRAPQNQPLDGLSIVPILRNPATQLPRQALYQHFPGYLGAGADHWRTKPVGVIIAREWKLMEFYEDKSLQLYNLKADLGETNNLANVQGDRAAKMLAELQKWRQSVGAKMPTPNEPQANAPAPKPRRRAARNNASE